MDEWEGQWYEWLKIWRVMESKIAESSCYLCYQRNQAKPVREEYAKLPHLDKEEDFFSGWADFTRREQVNQHSSTLPPRYLQWKTQSRSGLAVCSTCKGWCEMLLETTQNSPSFFIMLFSTSDFYFDLFCFCFQGKAEEILIQGGWGQNEMTVK